MQLNDFIEELKKINIILTDKQLNQLEQYYKLLIEWNNKINLTNITKKEDVYLKHFYDSLTINKIIDLNKVNTLCDIGTGAGFPGIVLKICFPHINVTLIDSLNKRVIFLNHVINQLDLKNITAICIRSEDYSKLYKDKFEIVTARAVSKLNILLEISSQLIQLNGYFIAMKSSDDELKNINNCLTQLNFELNKCLKFNLPYEESNRTLIKIKKINKTNIKYPRKYGIIKKNPL